MHLLALIYWKKTRDGLFSGKASFLQVLMCKDSFPAHFWCDLNVTRTHHYLEAEHPSREGTGSSLSLDEVRI